MRLVLDTNIIVSALLWNGAPSRLLDKAIDVDADIVTSAALLGELGRTLLKGKLERIIENSGKSVPEWLSLYANICVSVIPDPIQPIAPDSDDDWVIATALAAEADLIVTGDKPLLGVGAVGKVRIVSVAEALEAILAGLGRVA